VSVFDKYNRPTYITLSCGWSFAFVFVNTIMAVNNLLHQSYCNDGNIVRRCCN